MDWRDPLDSNDFETGHLWAGISGAQLADYVRLEVLWRHGGIYVDADVEPVRSMESLLRMEAFACWEDRRVIPNAVIGAVPQHPAIRKCLDLAIAVGAHTDVWMTGPNITTKVFRGRDDVFLLSPEYFYPYHYTETERANDDFSGIPWTYGVHHWDGSWTGKVSLSKRIFRRAKRFGVSKRLRKALK